MELARQLRPGGEEREPVGLALQTASFDDQEEVLYAPGTQTTRVSGDVVRWHLVNGAEFVPAADYIQVSPVWLRPALRCFLCGAPPPSIGFNFALFASGCAWNVSYVASRLAGRVRGDTCNSADPHVQMFLAATPRA